MNSLRHRSPAPAWEVFARSSVGGRTTNQDQVRAELLDPARNLWGWSALAAVADGMGGHEDGARASSLAMETVWEVLGAEADDRAEFSEAWLSAPAADLIARTIRLANNRIYSPNSDDAYARSMGTTLTLVAMRDDEAVIGHVGDSRLYVADDEGLRQITPDHTFVAEAVAAGTLTPEEAADSPFIGQLTRGVGLRSELAPDVLSISVHEGMTMILCSDGLTGVVNDDDILAAARQSASARALTEGLITLAEARQPTDNISVACLRRQGSKG